MRFNSDLMWSIYLIGTALLFFWVGNLVGSSQTERNNLEQIRKREEKIEILDRENQQLSKELTSRGIYSYPQASVLSEEDMDYISILVMLNGKEQLEDLVVEKTLIPNYSQISTEEANKSTTTKSSAYLGNLKSHTPAAIKIPLKEKEAAVEFSFESGNNNWKQFIRVKKNPAGRILSFWVLTNGNDVIIDKHIDEGFPLEEDGTILLWEDKRIHYAAIEMNSSFEAIISGTKSAVTSE